MPRLPVASFTIGRTGCYGCVRWTKADGGCGISGHPCTHWGLDLFGKGSRNVISPADGEVVAVAPGSGPPWSGYGPMVVAIRGGGKYLVMTHLDRAVVAKGDRVREGQLIGTFDADYGHTHFEVRHELTGPSSTNTMDPFAWLAGERAWSALKLAGLAYAGFWLTRRLARGVAS